MENLILNKLTESGYEYTQEGLGYLSLNVSFWNNVIAFIACIPNGTENNILLSPYNSNTISYILIKPESLIYELDALLPVTQV